LRTTARLSLPSRVATISDRLLEGPNVDPERPFRTQFYLLALELQVAGDGTRGGLQGLAGHVEGVAQVIRGGLSVEVRPEQAHQPLPVQSVLVRKGEQFQQACGLFEAPGTHFESPRPNRDKEAAEHVYAHGLWLTGRSFSSFRALFSEDHPHIPPFRLYPTRGPNGTPLAKKLRKCDGNSPRGNCFRRSSRGVNQNLGC
jgi:hypothetical protein